MVAKLITLAGTDPLAKLYGSKTEEKKSSEVNCICKGILHVSRPWRHEDVRSSSLLAPKSEEKPLLIERLALCWGGKPLASLPHSFLHDLHYIPASWDLS